MGDAFSAGVRPGGLTKDSDIRILICHILASAGGTMSFDQLTEAAMADGAANYFEFAEAATQLAQLDCLTIFRDSGGALSYSLTEKGEEAAASLARELPAAIRERAAESARESGRRRRLEKENTVAIDRADDGYTVLLRVTDIGTDLMELRLFMPTFEQAVEVKTRFLNDPAAAYKCVLEALAGKV